MRKKILSVMVATSLVLGTGVVAIASLGTRSTYIAYLSPTIDDVQYGKGNDYYVTATDYGNVYEDHSFMGGDYPSSFIGRLVKKRTLLPNLEMDRSTDPNGWNRASDIKGGDEFRTDMEIWKNGRAASGITEDTLYKMEY